MSYHLIDVIGRLGKPRVLVIGDLILDRYVWGDAERVSQEAPVILLREDRHEDRLGGGANVANLLRGLEADVCLAGVVGDDDDGAIVRRELVAAGVHCDSLLIDTDRPTTVKQRFIGLAQHRHPHQMLRVDREDRSPLSPYLEDELILRIALQMPACDAVLISDYAKGVCTPRLLHMIIDECRRRKLPVIVDPAASADYRRYCYATAITPNRAETSRAVGRPIATADDAFAAGKRLCLQLQLDYCFVTLDSDGIALVRADGSCKMLRTRKREVYDITGAGDMVLATIGVGAAAGIDPVDLAALANIAGGLEVEQVGVVRVTRQQMLADMLATRRATSEKVCSLDEAARHVAARKGLNQRIVFTNGCFDLLHPGHVRFLDEASSHGDCLVVAINSDDSVRSLKGPTRPVIGESDRAAMLAALECVDYVVVFREATPLAVLSELQPHVLVKGGTTPEVVGRELVESCGGEVLTLNTHGTYSTTDVVDRIRKAA